MSDRLSTPSDYPSGRISDDPEGFIQDWLRARAQDVEDGYYFLERISQTFPAGPDAGLFEFTIQLRWNSESDGPE